METVFFLGCLGFEEANVHLITLYHLLFTLKVLVRLIEQNKKGPNLRGPSGCLILSREKKVQKFVLDCMQRRTKSF